MNGDRQLHVDDLAAALAEAKDQLRATVSLLNANGERRVAEELAAVEAALIDAEVRVEKKFTAISETAPTGARKAA